MRTFALVEKRTKKHSPFRFDYWLRVSPSEPDSFYGGLDNISFFFLPVIYASPGAGAYRLPVLRLARSAGNEWCPRRAPFR